MFNLVKNFCNIPSNVTLYDDEINQLIAEAMNRLAIAGCTTDQTNEQVIEYVCAYCRLRLTPNPDSTFVDSENARLLEIIDLLYFGTESSDGSSTTGGVSDLAITNAFNVLKFDYVVEKDGSKTWHSFELESEDAETDYGVVIDNTSATNSTIRLTQALKDLIPKLQLRDSRDMENWVTIPQNWYAPNILANENSKYICKSGIMYLTFNNVQRSGSGFPEGASDFITNLPPLFKPASSLYELAKEFITSTGTPMQVVLSGDGRIQVLNPATSGQDQTYIWLYLSYPMVDVTEVSDDDGD